MVFTIPAAAKVTIILIAKFLFLSLLEINLKESLILPSTRVNKSHFIILLDLMYPGRIVVKLRTKVIAIVRKRNKVFVIWRCCNSLSSSGGNMEDYKYRCWRRQRKEGGIDKV